jgi:biuret amidohydrolase
MGVFQWRQALAWQRKDSPDDVHPWFLRDSPGHAIVPELTPLETEAVFDKIGMSAFEGTPLDTALRDCGIRTILIARVATEIGIEPTVRHAADLGYLPILIEDACGAGDAEAGERAMASMRFMGDALFTTVAETTALLRRRSG